MKMQKFVVLIILGLIIITNPIYSQSLDSIKIKEYYWSTPLSKVLSDFKVKYKIKVEYNPTEIAEYKFDDRGRFDAGISVEKAFLAICNDFPKLTFYIDENGIVYLEKNVSSKKKDLINSKYNGKATKYDFTISGIIKDSESGETLPFASVLVKGTTNGTTSNADGYFTLFKVPSDTSTLEISYLEYKTTLFFLNPKTNLSNIILNLEANTEILGEVIITAEKNELMQSTNKVSVVKMSPKKMSKLPSIGETDIFRSFQLLPGISGSNESSSGLFVRGGTPDQNLILYDGFTVYQVDHLFGMFSAFNSNAVKDVQLNKGGFESKFGGRISSVMEITGKDGNENKFNIGGEIGLLSGNVFAEIPIAKKATILIAGRRSWQSFIYNNIFESFSETNESDMQKKPAPPSGKGNRIQESSTPSSYFYDLNAKISYKPTNKDIFSYSFFNGLDDLNNSKEIDRNRGGIAISGGTYDITKWGNWGMSTVWSRKWNNIFYTNTLASLSNYYSNRELTNSRIITNLNGETTERNRGSIEDNNLKDYSFKSNNELKLNTSNQLEFGVQATHYTIDYDYTLNDTINIQERHDNGNLLSGYLQDNIKLFGKLTFTPGIRASYYDVTKKMYYEPRASLSCKLTKKINLKAAWGQYYQFANKIIRDDISSGSRDFWVLGDDLSVPISYSEHFILGTGYETKRYLFNVEAYYKKLSGLSEYSLQFAPSFNNVNFNEFFYKGTGETKGVEFLVQKKYGNYNGWASYTIGEVLYDFPIYGENSFYANHDVTNEFKIVNTYKYKKFTFSGTWIFATGKPYTEPLGGYSVTLLDGSTQDFLSIGDKNTARYDDYHRLDLSATYDFKMGKNSLGSIGFSIFNFYNRNNIWYKTFEVEEGDLIETDINHLGITPSITLSIKLR